MLSVRLRLDYRTIQYDNGIEDEMGRPREFEVEEALDSALEVFWAKGYEGTSLDDLTRAMGITRPSIYAAFGDKQSLYLRALERYDSSYMAFIKDALAERTSRRVVERLLRGFLEVQTKDSAHRGCFNLNGALACSDASEAVQQELVRRRSVSERALARRLSQAREEGELPAASDPLALAAFVMAVSQGMAVQAKAGASVKKLETIIQHTLATWPTSPSSTRRA